MGSLGEEGEIPVQVHDQFLRLTLGALFFIVVLAEWQPSSLQASDTGSWCQRIE